MKRLRRCHLSDAARRQHARPHLVPGPAARNMAFLVTHNESISISDYFTARDASGTAVVPAEPATMPIIRLTMRCLSLHEMFGRAAKMQEKHHILDENEIVDGIDELGVLLFGHDNNATGMARSSPSEETRKLAPIRTPPACK